MKTQLFMTILVISVCITTTNAQDKIVLTDEYFEYIKSTLNPYEWGLRDDGRFYPYSRPGGRMIGYGQQEFDKIFYSEGMSKKEAEKNLRSSLEKTLNDLREYLKAKYPKHPFDKLSIKSQEILLDLTYHEGPENLSSELYKTVLAENYDRMFDEFLYIRWIEKGWPYTVANKAFADRWLDPETRNIPDTNEISKILNKGTLE
jgi:GH24 family phage-related lysozyme (muramidase)